MNKKINEYRNCAWKYFALHADQRLKAFNSFLILSTLIVGAFATLVEKNNLKGSYILLPMALTFSSFVFWKLEERTRMLVNHGEEALKYLDKLFLENDPDSFSKLALFYSDDNSTTCLSKYPLWNCHFSYSRCFRWVFITTGITSVIGATTCLTL